MFQIFLLLAFIGFTEAKCVGTSSLWRGIKKNLGPQPSGTCHRSSDCCEHGKDYREIICTLDGWCVDDTPDPEETEDDVELAQEARITAANAIEDDVGVESGYVSYNWKKVPDVQAEGRGCIKAFLMSEEECKAYANTPKTGRTWRDTFDRDTWPQGCVITEEATVTNVYFNTNEKNPKFFKPKAKAVCNYWVKNGVHHFGIFSVEHSNNGYSLLTYGLASIGVVATVYGAYTATKKVMA